MVKLITFVLLLCVMCPLQADDDLKGRITQSILRNGFYRGRSISFQAKCATFALNGKQEMSVAEFDKLASRQHVTRFKVWTDGPNTVAESDMYAFAITPQRSFALCRDDANSPYSILAVSEIFSDDGHAAELKTVARTIGSGFSDLLIVNNLVLRCG